MACAHEELDVLAARAGNDHAFARLVARYSAFLAGILRRFSTDDGVIQDLVQETLLETFRSLGTYKCVGTFPFWLRQIALRVGYRYWAGKTREVRAKAAYVELYRFRPHVEAAVHKHNVEYAREMLESLNRCDHTLMEMRYIEGLSTIEIACAMGWNAERVRVRLHRAVKKLRGRQTGRGN